MVTYEHSKDDDSVAVDIVLLVAEQTGLDPAQLPSIEETIEPQALDALFASAQTTDTQDGYVEFTYCHHNVTVPLDGDRAITVAEEPQATPS